MPLPGVVMTRVRILVADDADFMYEMLENLIDKNRFEVIGYAADGEEAVKKFKDLSPDLVTMDILMPRMNGIKSIKEIRRVNPRARVLVISALSDPDLVKEAMAAGASDYITKPFSVSDLKARIAKVMDAKA
jgi:two-component system chemotaxis response regulator CheY